MQHLSKKLQVNKIINDRNSIQNVCFATTVLVMQLYKYSSYLYDSVFLKFKSSNQVIEINIPLTSDTTFNAVYDVLKEKLVINSIEQNISEWKIEWVTDNEGEKADYTIQFKHLSKQVTSHFTCSHNAFFSAVFKQASTHFSNIYQQVLKDQTLSSKDLSYLDANHIFDIEKMSYGPINEEIGIPELLHQLFEKTALIYPDHTAILFENSSISYQELNQKANILADFLVSQGLKTGDFVGILLNRSPEVYISMLAILKAGGAYVPLDISYPEDRVTYILQDAAVKTLISKTTFSSHYTNFKGNVLNIDTDLTTLYSSTPAADIYSNIIYTDSPAYVIYTSGSTGRPKGVVISHAAISNLVKAEKLIFQLSEHDKIVQGFSVAFDASLEEIWLTFATGATLFPVSEEIMHSGLDLSEFIILHHISVLSTVPTMLSMMTAPLPSLKLLILGGENCPHELLQRWHHEGLRITNSYGPTEATVIATYANFNPKEKITIGKPVINYACFVVDEQLNLVAPGIAGELCIAGKGLATGYLNREDLTKEKFISPSFTLHQNYSPRMYRTGDLVRYNENEQLEFLGRIDTQVKLRGYRIELSEIEAHILQTPNIKNVVVVVKEDAFKVQKLVAYILLKDTTISLDEENCKDYLKSKMAAYMVPAIFVVLDSFPILPSGKVDRKQLPEPKTELKIEQREIIEPRNHSEKQIHILWKKYFAPHLVSIYDDFFDLGGHSLLASIIVSELRRLKGFEKISVKDIYTYRTIEKLGEYINQEEKQSNNKRLRENKPYTRVSSKRYALTTLLQTGSFFLFMLVSSTGLLSPFIIEKIYPNINPYKLIALSSLFILSTFPALIIVSILIKWLVIGRFKAGSYPLWGSYYFRFWLVKKFVDLTPLGLLSGTPFLNLYFRLMGAKIGKGVYLGSDRIRIFDLCTIGEGSSIAREAHLAGYTVQNGELIIGSINIGNDCYVGTRSALSENSIMGNHSTLGELSLLPKGIKIPDNEHWEGSPALKVSISKIDKLESLDKKKSLPYGLYLFLQFTAILVLLLFPLTLIIPFALTFYKIDMIYGFHWAIIYTIPSTALYLVLFCLFIAGVKWIVLGKTKEEDFSIYSIRYIQKWTVDMIMQFTLLSFKSIYATIYLPSWLRLMGAKIGWRAEISTVNQISTDLLSVGDGSFLADSVSIGSPIVRNGVMFLRKTSIGNKSFIGNNAVLACGDHVGNECLIGVLSVPPYESETGISNGTSWLGSPPMFLPKRQQSQDFPTQYTFHPTKDLILKRGLIEFFKITVPFALTTCLVALFYKLIYDVLLIERFLVVVSLAPFILFGLSVCTLFLTALFKWILMGTYKPSNKPLWSVFVWKNEFINSLCESMVYPLLVNMFLGTPYARWFFIMMGSKIGKRVFMETTEITEFDLVHIDDEACLNNLATLQTHLFEDRVMKMSDLYIGKQCSVGSLSVVLYDSVMEDESTIASLSLVMKGETIPSKTNWEGSPAKFVS
jgi:non-ribosomal peptide synthetase-like protein